MTKVIISPSIVEYCQGMANAVEQVRREQTIAGQQPCIWEEEFPVRPDVISSNPCMAGLLQPPRIESLDADVRIRNGQLDGIIQVWTSGDFGIMDVYVIIADNQGNVTDSGYAMRNEIYMNHWSYILEVDVRDYHSLTVQAIVFDLLGGIGTQILNTTVG